MTHLSDLIAALRKGDGNGCRHANALMQEAADALMANQGAIVNSIIERTRTEVPEPSAGRRDLTPCGNLVCTGCRVCGCPALGITPQGEPSDASVRAALREWFQGIIAGGWTAEHEAKMRAALRAAGGVR